MSSPIDHPKLRPVEVLPVSPEAEMFVVFDPTGLAEGSISLSRAALYILSLMDGQRSLEDIRRVFAEQTGAELPAPQLAKMVEQLDRGRFLDSPSFDAHLAKQVAAYRASPARVSGDEASLGAADGKLAWLIEQMVSDCRVSVTGPRRRLAGLIAPHLDYARGWPGYADAYGLLAMMPAPRRVVILGTNHFGSGAGPVATRKDFRTPLGTTRTDRDFIDALSGRLGVDLCEHEFDHQREHSIELQVVIMQYLLGAGDFEIVPVLCGDVCGPTGTAPHNGRGADLRSFGEMLGDLMAAEADSTLVVAGADLSHVGRRFGDNRELDEAFLREVQGIDRRALEVMLDRGRDAFVEELKSHDNSTRVCSAGCIYALLTALPRAQGELLRYHQAADPDTGTCVTCSAVAFWEAERGG